MHIVAYYIICMHVMNRQAHKHILHRGDSFHEYAASFYNNINYNTILCARAPTEYTDEVIVRNVTVYTQ